MGKIHLSDFTLERDILEGKTLKDTQNFTYKETKPMF